MLEVVGQFGPDLRPTVHALREPLLKIEVEETKKSMGNGRNGKKWMFHHDRCMDR